MYTRTIFGVYNYINVVESWLHINYLLYNEFLCAVQNVYSDDSLTVNVCALILNVYLSNLKVENATEYRCAYWKFSDP